MSRKFCVLPFGFSEACAADCENRHVHKNAKEICELEAAGEIQYCGMHPVKKQPRYVWRVHNTQRVNISASVMQAATGAYRNDLSEIRRAQSKIKFYGSEKDGEHRAFMKLHAGTRVVVLPRVKWNDDGLVANFPSDGQSAGDFEKVPGKPVRVTFKPKIAESQEAVAYYWNLIKPRKAPGNFVFVGPDGRMLPQGTVKMRFARLRAALKNLDRHWGQIVDHFDAGPYSGELTSTLASELPSSLLQQVLSAYLYDV